MKVERIGVKRVDDKGCIGMIVKDWEKRGVWVRRDGGIRWEEGDRIIGDKDEEEEDWKDVLRGRIWVWRVVEEWNKRWVKRV